MTKLKQAFDIEDFQPKEEVEPERDDLWEQVHREKRKAINQETALSLTPEQRQADVNHVTQKAMEKWDNAITVLVDAIKAGTLG